MTTWVKVCGITNIEDALVAVDAGADALGFIFARSPRRVEPHQAAAIIGLLPRGVQAVGVFVDAPAEEVGRTAELCGLSLVQLHGQEPPEMCAALCVPAIKAFRVAGRDSLAALAPYRGRLFGYLLDTYVPGQAGGTGATFDHALAIEAKTYGPIIVAGGLSAANVAQAILQVRPFGVDASSRLEAAPGRKDHQLVRDFISEIRRADATRP